MKKSLAAALLGFGAALFLAAGAAPLPAKAATPDDVLVMAKNIDDIINLDPAESFEISAGEMMGNSYDRLVRFDPADPSNIYGDIAESWTVSDDGKTFTFKIRPGQSFHSGNPVTAEDAAFSLQRVVILDKSPAFILTQFGWNADNVADLVKAVDAHRAWLETSGELRTRRRARARGRVRDVVDRELRRVAWSSPETSARLDAGLDEIEAGAATPYSVARGILGALLR